MKKTSYTIKHDKNPDSAKPHKPLRGLRCYVSSLLFNKHTTKPDINLRSRISKMVDKLSPSGKNVALLSYHKSRHNSIIICDIYYDTYSYVSAYGNGVSYVEDLSSYDLVDLILREALKWSDGLSESNVVYIENMNVDKIRRYIMSNAAANKFNILTNNCSRFAADVLIAGCDATPDKFVHNRSWQMPANTLELAREINQLSKKKRRL